ncbi:MAG: EpsG family protein [Muribaculaceae bacterium]|nr:EpsG family protein [Muribaculaceae bacterium]
MIYFVVIFSLLILIYVYDYRRCVKGRETWLVLITLLLILIGGLHYRLGLDNPQYYNFYKKLHPLNSLTLDEIKSIRFAPGFVVLASFTKLFTPELILLNFIQSAFVCSAAVWFFKNNTRNPFFSILLFFFFLYTLLIFEQIREAIAAGFFLLAWPYYNKGNWLVWYLYALVASLFHTSAMIMFFLPLFSLPFIKQFFLFGKRTWIICIAVFIFAFSIQLVFFRYVQLISSFSASAQELTNKYEGTNVIKGNLNILGLIGAIIRSVVFPLISLYFLNYAAKKSGKRFYSQRFEILTLLSIYISLVSLSIPIIFRFNNYLLFFPIVIMSDWLFSLFYIGKKKVRLRFIYWIILFIPLFASQTYLSYLSRVNASGSLRKYMAYYPYTSYLDKNIDNDRERLYTYVKKIKL